MNDFKCSCPHCGQHIQGDGQWRGRELQCPACQETLIVPGSQPIPIVFLRPTQSPRVTPRPSGALPRWVRVAWLVVLGALTPVIVTVAMVVTGLLGRLAFVVGPALGTLVSIVLTRHCWQQAPPQRFWIYPVSTLSVYGLILLSAFLPGGSKSGGHEPSLAGAQAAMSGGLVLLVVLGSALFWSLGAAVAIASRRDDTPEPSFP